MNKADRPKVLAELEQYRDTTLFYLLPGLEALNITGPWASIFRRLTDLTDQWLTAFSFSAAETGAQQDESDRGDSIADLLGRFDKSQKGRGA